MRTCLSKIVLMAGLMVSAIAAQGESWSQTKSLMPLTASGISIERSGNGGILEAVIPTVNGCDLQFYFPKAYGNVYLQMSALVDGTGYDGHVVEFVNMSPGAAKFDFAIYSDVTLGQTEACVPWQVNIPVGERQKNLYYWSKFNGDQGMFLYPPALNEASRIYNINPAGTWNKTRIKGYRIYNLLDNSRILVKGIRLIKKRPNFNNMIDEFGQWTDLSWSSKVTLNSQLVDRKASETTLLNSQPNLAAKDGTPAWGRSRATGKWRVEKSPSGTWFFVTPTGNRYWAMGTQTLLSGAATITEGRLPMFENLPTKETAGLAQFYSKKQFAPTGAYMDCYDFYSKNLFLKYGATWRNDFVEVTNKRFDKWGFNMITGHIEEPFYTSGRPYVKYFNTYYYPKRFQTPFTAWYPPVDPYEPSFKIYVQDQARALLAQEIAGARPQCIGVSVDNELSWGYMSPYAGQEHLVYSIPIGAMNQVKDMPVKVAMLAWLKGRYQSNISSLNFAWGSSYASWADLEKVNALGNPTNLSVGLQRDLKEMLKVYADQYYKTVKAALAATGFRGLYLGSRDSIDATPVYVWQTAAKYVDVLTVNLYTMRNDMWNNIAGLGKPVMISEFGFTSMDRGHAFPNLDISTHTQEERAAKTEAFLKRALQCKNVIGANVWCYTETMPSGRWADNERFNSGIVDITDTPVTPMVEVFQRTARDFATLRKS